MTWSSKQKAPAVLIAGEVQQGENEIGNGTQNGNGSPIRNHKTIHITDYKELEPSRTAVNRDTIHIARWISQCRKI
jgi:hypothetical protein